MFAEVSTEASGDRCVDVEPLPAGVPPPPPFPPQFHPVESDCAINDLPEWGSDGDDQTALQGRMSVEEADWLLGPTAADRHRGRQAEPGTCVRTPSPSPPPRSASTMRSPMYGFLATGGHMHSCTTLDYSAIGMWNVPHRLLQSHHAGPGMESLVQPQPPRRDLRGLGAEPPAQRIWAGRPKQNHAATPMLGSTWTPPPPPPPLPPASLGGGSASKCRTNGSRRKAMQVTAGPVPICSKGSIGHPRRCADACKYAFKKRGCKDGAACDHCHLCVWRNPFPRHVSRQR